MAPARKNKKARLDPTCAPFRLCRKTEPSFDEAFESVAKILEGRKKVLVLAGAGISVSCGIPDFRSKDKGLYSTLDFQELGLSCPEDLFDFDFFQDDPRPFYKFSKSLYFPLGDGIRVEPSDSHRFLALLETKKQLLRVYTQNIDGLEEIAGVPSKRMVYAHGSLQWASCSKCKQRVDASAIEPYILEGKVPLCTASVKTNSKAVKSATRSEYPRLKRHQQSANEGVCGGVLKPGVTFFGETLHDKVRRSLESDRGKADCLIVIGTSLSVAPMSKVLRYLPTSIPRILINRTLVHPPIKQDDEDDDEDEDLEFREHYAFDAYLLGFCDDVTRALAKEMYPSTQKRKDIDGRLLANLREDDKAHNIEDWESIEIPPDRILLFPGATSGFDVTEATYNEIAHCDGCADKILGRIRKCIQCFDYDLCEQCYPALSQSHHGGKHRFSVEGKSQVLNGEIIL